MNSNFNQAPALRLKLQKRDPYSSPTIVGQLLVKWMQEVPFVSPCWPILEEQTRFWGWQGTLGMTTAPFIVGFEGILFEIGLYIFFLF